MLSIRFTLIITGLNDTDSTSWSNSKWSCVSDLYHNEMTFISERSQCYDPFLTRQQMDGGSFMRQCIHEIKEQDAIFTWASFAESWTSKSVVNVKAVFDAAIEVHNGF